MSEKSNRLFGAPITMRKKGEVTDSTVLEEIMRKPGVTVSEIAETLGWSNGKVDGSVKRLLLRGKVSVKHYLRRGMLVKRVYPEKYPVKPRNTIEVPEKMVESGLWKDSAVVYALSRSTMGIAPKEVEEWDKKAFFKDCIDVRKEKENIVFTLPERFYDFYQLENSEMSLSTVGNFVLATVESMLPVKLPATYPEEGRYPIARYRITLESERVEGVYLREGKTKELTFFSKSRYSIVNKQPEKIRTAISSEPCKEFIKVPVEAK
ncbi:MAG: winged helix-turn-helix domain-containing protein [Candidatus Bathyarchaeia archaeon]|nr:winged helix-turn-helix domain-containing protein [Candidatus Bathyarchaeia archaeon]